MKNNNPTMFFIYRYLKSAAKAFMLTTILLSTSLTLANQAVDMASDIGGVWKHAQKPVMIKIDEAKKRAFVAHHEVNAEAEGLTIIKNIEQDKSLQNRWSGDMYNGYIDKYQTVTLILSAEDTLQIKDDAGKVVLTLHR